MKLGGVLTVLGAMARVARASASIAQQVEARTGAGTGTLIGAAVGGVVYAVGADETTAVSTGAGVAAAVTGLISVFGRVAPNTLIVKAGVDRAAVMERLRTGKGVVTLYAISPPAKPEALKWRYEIGIGADGGVYDLRTYQRLGDYWL